MHFSVQFELLVDDIQPQLNLQMDSSSTKCTLLAPSKVTTLGNGIIIFLNGVYSLPFLSNPYISHYDWVPHHKIRRGFQNDPNTRVQNVSFLFS